MVQLYPSPSGIAMAADPAPSPLLQKPAAPLPVPCVTLLSDLGLHDASLAAVKGTLLRHLPNADFIDISHNVEPFHHQQAAYLLLACYGAFAPGSCHVVLFDIFAERAPRMLLCEHEGHFFLAPDNGVLPLAFGTDLPDVRTCYELPPGGTFSTWMEQVGRIVATLQSGGKAAVTSARSTDCTMKAAPVQWRPNVWGDAVECQVVHVDRYENVVVNMRREYWEELCEGRPFRIKLMRADELTTISNAYYEVPPGEKLCRFNRTGFLEICINRGKAASLLGLKLHRENQLIYSSIKIFFD